MILTEEINNKISQYLQVNLQVNLQVKDGNYDRKIIYNTKSNTSSNVNSDKVTTIKNIYYIYYIMNNYLVSFSENENNSERLYEIFSQLYLKDLIYHQSIQVPYQKLSVLFKVADKSKFRFFKLGALEYIDIHLLVSVNNYRCLQYNQALCVNPNIYYSCVYDTIRNCYLIMSVHKFDSLLIDVNVDVDNKSKYKLCKIFTGDQLNKLYYESPTNTNSNNYVILDTNMTYDTEIIQLSPEYPEYDNYDRKICQENGIKDISDLNIPENKSNYIIFDSTIKQRIKKSWFLNISKIRNRILNLNNKIHWKQSSMKKVFISWIKNNDSICISHDSFYSKHNVSDKKIICVNDSNSDSQSYFNHDFELCCNKYLNIQNDFSFDLNLDLIIESNQIHECLYMYNTMCIGLHDVQICKNVFIVGNNYESEDLISLSANTIDHGFFCKYYNAVIFLQEHILLFNKYKPLFKINDNIQYVSNFMDIWIINQTNLLSEQIRLIMNYDLNASVSKLISKYIYNLTNWYIRLNRQRFKGNSIDLDDWVQALTTLNHVINKFNTMLMPFCPYIIEFIINKFNLKLNKITSTYDININININTHATNLMKSVIKLIRIIRYTHKMPLTKPIYNIRIGCNTIVDMQILEKIHEYIQNECNIMHIIYDHNFETNIRFELIPNYSMLKKYLLDNNISLSAIKYIENWLGSIDRVEIKKFMDTGYIHCKIQIPDLNISIDLYPDYIKPIAKFNVDNKFQAVDQDKHIYVIANLDEYHLIRPEYIFRLVNKKIKLHLKTFGLKQNTQTKVNMYFDTRSVELKNFLINKSELFLDDLIVKFELYDHVIENANLNYSQYKILNDNLKIYSYCN